MTIHIFGQFAEHSEVIIVGDIAALTDLRDAINKALANGQSAFKEAYTNDGEGYDIHVIKAKPEVLDTLRRPYTCESSEDKRKTDVIDPWDLVKRDK